jgi:hypothetical protein
VANGSYIYTVGGVPGWTTYSYSGAVYEDGSSATFTISWTRTLYALTFVESGLPAGGEWSVYLDGTRQVSTSSSMVFDVSNGTYSYTVESPTNYSATPSSGSLKVSGSPATQNITFSSGLGFLGMPGDEGYFVLGAAIGLVALAAVVVAIFLRRRPRENIRPPPLAFEEANEIRPIPPEPPHLPPWTGSHSVDSDLTEAVPPESGSDGMA